MRSILILLISCLTYLVSGFSAPGWADEGHEAMAFRSKHKYALELIYEPGAQTSIDALDEMTIWSMEVDRVLKEAGYIILDTHYYHNPTVWNLPCQSPKTVENILQLIKDNGLAPPSSYQLLRQNPGLDASINLLLSIESQDSGIIFSGGIPSKSLTDALLGENLNYKMSIKDPTGKKYSSRFRQRSTKAVEQIYPQDFDPVSGSLIPGNYDLTIYIDDQVVWVTNFTLTETHNIDWQH